MLKCRMIYLLRRFNFEARSCIHGTSRGASRTPPTPGFLVAASSYLPLLPISMIVDINPVLNTS